LDSFNSGAVMDPPAPDIPDRCLLEHTIFTVLGPVMFRRSAQDGAPVMIIPFGDREASVPLRSLQREFGIGDETPDGRMLGLIAESLDFVAGLQPGDKLPAEVLNGKASWEPRQQHRALAAARVRLRLLTWLQPDALAGDLPGDADSVRRLDEDPQLRVRVAGAFAAAAETLGLPGPNDVVRLVEELAEELAYIESLRDTLLRRIKLLAARVEHLGRNRRAGDANRMEPINQVGRLTSIALKQIGGRFDEVDAQTGEVLAALRNAGSQQSFIRSNRDFLYRCQRAWDPILKEWDHAGTSLDDWTWHLIGRTYQFLAPRYMPVTEWQAFNSLRQARSARQPERAMTW
jgi:hypothetical protein